jgi:hypothetical protein
MSGRGRVLCLGMRASHDPTLKDIGGLQVTAWVAVFATPQLFIMSAIFESGQMTGNTERK